MKIAIVGTATSEKEAPYNDPSWQIWSLGATQKRTPRYDRWFELHTQQRLVKDKVLVSTDLKECKEKLYLIEPWPQFPDASLYPKQEIIAKYGTYFTSSIAWMLIMAIHEGATEIGFWGVHMGGENEYQFQRPCCEFWIGRALEKGIKVKIHPDSSLLKGEMYCDGLYWDVCVMEKEAKEKAELARDENSYRVGYYDALRKIKRTFG